MSVNSYPGSLTVTAGQLAQASQFNGLRKDALYLGQEVTNAVALATALRRYSAYIKLTKQSAAVVRIPYDLKQPPTLMINGCLLQLTALLDSPALTGTAGTYYLHAVRTDGSTAFGLEWSASASEIPDRRLLASVAWDGTNIGASSITLIDANAGGSAMKKATAPAVYLANNTNEGPYLSTTWLVIQAATATEYLLVGMTGNAADTVEIGVGAAGSEVVVCRQKTNNGSLTLPFVIVIPIGSRVVARNTGTNSLTIVSLQVLPTSGVVDY